MKAKRFDAVRIEEHYLLSVDELDDRWGLCRSQLREFIASGVLEPSDDSPEGALFSISSLSVVQTACRLQRDLELDTHAVGVVLGLLQRIEGLERQLGALEAHLTQVDAPDEEPPEAEVISLSHR